MLTDASGLWRGVFGGVGGGRRALACAESSCGSHALWGKQQRERGNEGSETVSGSGVHDASATWAVSLMCRIRQASCQTDRISRNVQQGEVQSRIYCCHIRQ